MPALHIENLCKTYDNGPQALKGVNLTVEEGDFFALLGPNGAGKSTAIGVISSLVNKTSGTVEVFGYDLDREPAKVKACIGLVPQEFNFNVFEPVVEILINQAGYYGIPRPIALERAEQSLKQLDLWDKRDTQARSLSGGMKRRLMIARALVHNPRLLILDEPTAGVDIEIRRSMWEFLTKINEEGTTIILTTHYLEEAENLCRNIAIIDHGKVAENTSMSDLLSQAHAEAFVLDLMQPLTDLPVIEGIDLTLKDDNTLEACINRGANFNQLFQALTEKGIEVSSMRNKQNRLEQLFIDMVKRGAEKGSEA